MAPSSALLNRPTNTRPKSRGSDFTPLLREIKDSGLLERRTGRYLLSIAVNLLCLAAVVAGMILLGNSWLVLLLAIPAAFLGQHVVHQVPDRAGERPHLRR